MAMSTDKAMVCEDSYQYQKNFDDGYDFALTERAEAVQSIKDFLQYLWTDAELSNHAFQLLEQAILKANKL